MVSVRVIRATFRKQTVFAVSVSVTRASFRKQPVCAISVSVTQATVLTYRQATVLTYRQRAVGRAALSHTSLSTMTSVRMRLEVSFDFLSFLSAAAAC